MLQTIGPSLTMAIPMLLGCGLAILSQAMTGGASSAFMFTRAIVSLERSTPSLALKSFNIYCVTALSKSSPPSLLLPAVARTSINNSIREFGYNLKTTPIVFVGGGAVVMKNFGSHDAKNISYNLDVKANARGYEQLATMGLKSTRRLS